jgi:hypothetical protein
MGAKLHLIKGAERRAEEAESGSEEKLRYPAHEEAWEVSCGPELDDRPRPKAVTDRWRAS